MSVNKVKCNSDLLMKKKTFFNWFKLNKDCHRFYFRSDYSWSQQQQQSHQQLFRNYILKKCLKTFFFKVIHSQLIWMLINSKRTKENLLVGWLRRPLSRTVSKLSIHKNIRKKSLNFDFCLFFPWPKTNRKHFQTCFARGFLPPWWREREREQQLIYTAACLFFINVCKKN